MSSLTETVSKKTKAELEATEDLAKSINRIILNTATLPQSGENTISKSSILADEMKNLGVKKEELLEVYKNYMEERHMIFDPEKNQKNLNQYLILTNSLIKIKLRGTGYDFSIQKEIVNNNGLGGWSGATGAYVSFSFRISDGSHVISFKVNTVRGCCGIAELSSLNVSPVIGPGLNEKKFNKTQDLVFSLIDKLVMGQHASLIHYSAKHKLDYKGYSLFLDRFEDISLPINPKYKTENHKLILFKYDRK